MYRKNVGRLTFVEGTGPGSLRARTPASVVTLDSCCAATCAEKMIASKAMKTTATVVSLVKVLAFATLAACGTQGKMRVDAPMMSYQAPDISEITGIEEPDTSDEGSGSGSAEPGK
ncbi:MAG: hypothetical protein JWO36_4 [Myxococcales bacterium]|nr:hypothetical protein [Myxococcales bacterium]